MFSNPTMARAAKVAVSSGLLAVLVVMVDWRDAWLKLANMPAWVTAGAAIMLAGQFVISAWKWRAALVLLRVKVPFRRLVKIYCIGAFFSNFLPSNVGGDVYRVYRTVEYGSLPKALFAVIFERLIGLVALAVVALAGVLWLLYESAALNATEVTASLSVLTAAYFLLPFVLPGARRLAQSWRPQRPAWLRNTVGLIAVESVGSWRMLELLAICLLFQIVATMTIALLFVGVDVDWAIAESAVANGAGSIIAIVPVSINGLGIAEASFAGVATRMGIGFTDAAIVSLMVRLLVLPMVMVFGMLYTFDRRVDPKAEFAKDIVELR